MFLNLQKNWLIHSLDDKQRTVEFNTELFKCELKLERDIYGKCNMTLYVNQIEELLAYL